LRKGRFLAHLGLSRSEDETEIRTGERTGDAMRRFSAEDKIRIVLEGLRGEDSIAELCRREGIVQNLYYRWSKDFLEAGKKRLAGDTARAAASAIQRFLGSECGESPWIGGSRGSLAQKGYLPDPRWTSLEYSIGWPLTVLLRQQIGIICSY
jgi:transposase-like protein